MIRENGTISIHTENILPIIKKWLYSDKDIFVRELVSNSNDANSKMKKLASIGEANVDPDTRYIIKVIVDKDKKTIQVIDNGIGMTGEEVKKYINQIAFSGAQDFLKKYNEKANEGNQIIGHFGLGFYSAFMVSERVQIDTLSFQEGAQAVKWISSGGTEYEMEPSDRTSRGTTVTLYAAEDSLDFLDKYKMREILMKYCSFLPFEIYLEDANETDLEETDEEGKDDKEQNEPKPVNDTHPLWLKNPKDCTEEEYKDFYRKVFHDFNDPLFWIHLNMDYPFNLKGILYFPKLKHEFETMEGQIKLFYNQVFVADNIKEVIPEFLMLLKGVLDCPDLPLNVSRSFLQNDGYVSKISSHITRKVADKLTMLFENERDSYNKFWDDINPFVKYGCVREQKFFDKVKDIIVYRTINGEYLTLKDYLDKNNPKVDETGEATGEAKKDVKEERNEGKEDRNKDRNKDGNKDGKQPDKKTVFYVSNEKQQAQYIRMFKDHGMEAVILQTMIDNHFIQFLEMKENGLKFTRVDSDISDSMKESGSSNEESDKKTSETLEKLFKDALRNDKLKVKVEGLKASSVPGMIILSEHTRRMQEMSAMFGGMGMGPMFGDDQTLVLNKKNGLIKTILKLKDNESKKDDIMTICQHIYDLAMLSHKQLEPDAMTRFIERSNKLLARLAEEELKVVS